VDAPRAPLTPVERKLWHYLIDFLATHTYQPSVREIARHFRIPSTRTVTDLIGALQTKGYVRRAPGRSRGVVIEGFAGGVGTQPVPVVRFTADGKSLTEGHLTLDRTLLPGDEAFLVRSTLEDAPAHAVREGDLLLVHPRARAADEAPVVARVGAVILARVLAHRGASIVLRAPRPDAEDIELGPGDDFAILGPLSGVIRVTAPRPDDDPDDNPDA
jgi:repressor LexA